MRAGSPTLRFSGPVLAVAATALVGCTGDVSAGDATGDAEATRTSAIVIVERSADAAGGQSAEASARFVRVAATSSTEDALRVVGAAIDLPSPGTCATVPSAPAGFASDDLPPFVELMDVGVVSLETSDGTATRLLPRQVPDVTDVVTGVVYARTADATALKNGGRYVLHVAGGSGIDGFDATADGAGDPNDVRASDEQNDVGIVNAAGAPIDVAWKAETAGDVAYVDVQPAGSRCVLGDGSAAGGPARVTVPATLLAETGALVVHRVRRAPLVAKGVDRGEIRFDFSRSVTYTRK